MIMIILVNQLIFIKILFYVNARHLQKQSKKNKKNNINIHKMTNVL